MIAVFLIANGSYLAHNNFRSYAEADQWLAEQRALYSGLEIDAQIMERD